jgi:hypothetical protein
MIGALLRKWFSHEQTTQERPGIPEGIARGAVAGSALREPVAGVGLGAALSSTARAEQKPTPGAPPPQSN